MLVGLQSPSGMAKLLLAWMGEPSPTLPSSQGRFDLSSAGSARVAGIIWGAAQPHPLVGWANPGGASSEQTQEVPALSSSFGKGNSRLCLPELVALGGCCHQHTTALRVSRQHQKTGEEKNLISSKGKWLVEKDKELQQPELWKALTKYLKRRNRKCFPSVRAFLMQVIRWLLPLLLKRHYFLSDPCKEGLEHTYSFSMCF